MLMAAMAMNLSWQISESNSLTFASEATEKPKLTRPQRIEPSQRRETIEFQKMTSSDNPECNRDTDSSCQVRITKDSKTRTYTYEITKGSTWVVKERARTKTPDELTDSDYEEVETMDITVAGTCDSCDSYRESYKRGAGTQFRYYHELGKELAQKLDQQFQQEQQEKEEQKKKDEEEEKKRLARQKKVDWCQEDEDGKSLKKIDRIECQAEKLSVMDIEDPRYKTFLNDVNNELPNLFFSPDEKIRERAVEMGLNIRVTDGVSQELKNQYAYLDKVSQYLLANVPKYANLPSGSNEVWTMYYEMDNLKRQVETYHGRSGIGQMIVNKIEEAQKKPQTFLGRVAPDSGYQNPDETVTDPRNGRDRFQNEYVPAPGDSNYNPDNRSTYSPANRGQNLIQSGQQRPVPGRGLGGSRTFYSPGGIPSSTMQQIPFGNGYGVNTTAPGMQQPASMNNYSGAGPNYYNTYNGSTYDFRTPGINPYANSQPANYYNPRPYSNGYTQPTAVPVRTSRSLRG